MIDLAENILSFADACRALPRRRRGRKPSTSTLWRWSTRGLRGIVLETIQVGGQRCTSVEALQRFFEQLSAGRVAAPSPRPDQRRHEVVERELASEGI